MKKLQCLTCEGETIIGDIRSGMVSFGTHFIEFLDNETTITGAPKPKPGVEKKNRVVSYACIECGYISNYLEKFVK